MMNIVFNSAAFVTHFTESTYIYTVTVLLVEVHCVSVTSGLVTLFLLFRSKCRFSDY